MILIKQKKFLIKQKKNLLIEMLKKYYNPF